jgi:predicted secreted hydrolase
MAHRKRLLPCFLGFALFWLVSVSGSVCPAEPLTKSVEWNQVLGPRTWQFPRDNGVHPAYRTEWWYFTGNLADRKGYQYGYELTFFREGVSREGPGPRNAWSVGDIYLAHLAISDVGGRVFTMEDRVSRTGPGIAGAAPETLHVWLRDWSAAEDMNGSIFLRARGRGMDLSLELRPLKPPVIHGKNGVSEKGSRPGQASYYVSYTGLSTRGSLKVPGSASIEVDGVSWFDHEFGSNQLTPDQAGWDWFSLHISDGRELMVYFLRRIDGSLEPASSGTIVDRLGKPRHLFLDEITIEVLDRWKSPKSGATYPSRWRIVVPSENIDFIVRPLLPDQELLTPETTGITYWEGAVRGSGLSAGKKATCEGYVELTGYAGKLGGLF